MAEHALLDRLREKAQSLYNGNRGNMDIMSEVVADMAHLLASIAEHGCHRFSEHPQRKFNWPACVATITGIGIVVAGLLQAVSILSE